MKKVLLITSILMLVLALLSVSYADELEELDSDEIEVIDLSVNEFIAENNLTTTVDSETQKKIDIIKNNILNENELVEENQEWEPTTTIVSTYTWENASEWAIEELNEADTAGLIPKIFTNADLTKSITRKEFAHIAVTFYEKIRDKEIVVTEITNPFEDTDDEYVLKAYKLGVTNGVSETEFAPNKEITREQLATMMSRTIEKIGVETSVNLSKVNKFADDNKMNDWSKEAIYFMSEAGIIKGVGENNFGVSGTATREQALLISIRSANKFAK